MLTNSDFSSTVSRREQAPHYRVLYEYLIALLNLEFLRDKSELCRVFLVTIGSGAQQPFVALLAS